MQESTPITTTYYKFEEGALVRETKEYKLEGGALLTDKTNGIATAVFSAGLTKLFKRPSYEIMVNGKKLVYPTSSDPITDKGIFLAGSRFITFEKTNVEYVKITEIDEATQTVFYVHLSKPIDDVAYDAYSYQPQTVSLEEARSKLERLRVDAPDFKGDIALYNRHGVAMFGWDQKTLSYGLYWASPQAEKMEKLECDPCTRYRDGGTSIAKAKNGYVNFRYLFGNGEFLNAEPAFKVSLAP